MPLPRRIGDHVRRSLARRPELEEAPPKRIDVAAIEDGFEVKVAACGPPGGAHACDGLAHFYSVAGAHANGLQMVVGGDEAVAVVNLYPVAAAPWVPAGRAYNTGISRIDRRAAGGRVVLPQMEVPG